jgi:hypothetical protein
MDKKTAAIVSYITIIGWLIAYFSTNPGPRESLTRYHLKQSLGLAIVGIVINIVFRLLIGFMPLSMALVLSFISLGIWIGYIVLLIIGCINASNEKEQPLPLIGKLIEGKADFIK